MLKTLTSLPDLPVRRETYCSHAVVEAVTHFLVQDQPELLERFQLEDFAGTDTDLSDAAWALLDGLQSHSAQLDVPSSALGRLDLVCEVSRRLRRAADRKDRRFRGRALSENPAALPPLCRVDITAVTLRALPQARVDEILESDYAAQPALWYAVAEECRVDLRLDATLELGKALLSAVQPRDILSVKDADVARALLREATRRIVRMCALDGQPLVPAPEQSIPPLIEMEVLPDSLTVGMTSEMIDSVLRQSYGTRPDLWHGTGEWARGLGPVAPQTILRQLLGELWEARYPGTGGPQARQAVFSEAYRRIYRMCGLEE